MLAHHGQIAVIPQQVPREVSRGYRIAHLLCQRVNCLTTSTAVMLQRPVLQPLLVIKEGSKPKSFLIPVVEPAHQFHVAAYQALHSADSGWVFVVEPLELSDCLEIRQVRRVHRTADDPILKSHTQFRRHRFRFAAVIILQLLHRPLRKPQGTWIASQHGIEVTRHVPQAVRKELLRVHQRVDFPPSQRGLSPVSERVILTGRGVLIHLIEFGDHLDRKNHRLPLTRHHSDFANHRRVDCLQLLAD